MLIHLKFKDYEFLAEYGGNVMPHEHIQLAQAPNGEIGPRCHTCGIRLTFGNAMVVDKYYMCWEHYVETTGSNVATEHHVETSKRFWMSE